METNNSPTNSPESNNSGTSGHSDSKLSPKFFFLSLGVIVSLITSATAFLNLAFETLDFKFPDSLNSTYTYGYDSYVFESARTSIAILIIFLPIFFVLMKYWRKTIKSGLKKIDEIIKKWMMYIIIFLAVLVVAIDLVTLVRYFVGGEITTRFILKVLAALLVAKWAGIYFYYELQESKYKKIIQKIVGWSFGVFSLVLIIWSFSVIGTPKEQRLWRLDQIRTNDLSTIQYQVINYWQQKEKLPEKLSDLISYSTLPVDPEFEKGNTYEYKKIDDLKFEVCATFSADMPVGWVEYGKGGGIVTPYYAERDMAVSYPYPGGGQQDSWEHDIGYKCFERTIDKDIYKPFKSI